MTNPDRSRFLNFPENYFLEYDQESLSSELYTAVVNSNLEEVKKFINAGADVNYLPDGKPIRADASCSAFSSILHVATSKEKLDVIKQLLKNGANVTATNVFDETPLLVYVAYRNEHMNDVIKELVMYGSSIHKKDRFGASSLHYSLDTRMVNLECCKALLRYDLFRNYKQNFRATIKNTCRAKGRDYGDIAGYLNVCNSEILQLKRYHVGYLSLHQFLLGNFFEENHVSTKRDYTFCVLRLLVEGSFPIYSDIILDCIKRNHLVNNLIKTEIYAVAYLGSEKVILNPDTIHHLSTFLSKDDLINLLKSFHICLYSNECSDLTKYLDCDLSICSFTNLHHLRNRTHLYNKSYSELPMIKAYRSRPDSVQPLNSSKHLTSIPAESVPKKIRSDVPLNDSEYEEKCPIAKKTTATYNG